ncbi:hypothetical protein ABZ816_08150 [Actinosynnema sp. NPDC047251]|uniref:Uncharacterized protein n=1 Tax=Saccharothrix espanaensis (strain ATCC 51144 / DSM 44229 / JCM 9112 / NBRC 15066 / NRRL 15764) TaxID=1179773 RepID=K0JS00_SACES|nr:hypothetical protein [Saccharothrix espanaensis]CCH27569.1 hypothetical protein BN6_02360 [Saccharothrix espanaensis DSM 44229]
MPPVDAECYVCSSASGERLHLWLKALPGGGVWAWLAESALPAVEFTREESDRLLTLWADLRRMLHAGESSDQLRCVVVTEVDSRQRTVLVYGLQEGFITYWRVGEPRDPVLLDLNAMDELIEAWTDVRT